MVAVVSSEEWRSLQQQQQRQHLPQGPEYSLSQLAALPGQELRHERTKVQGWLKAQVQQVLPPSSDPHQGFHTHAAWTATYSTIVLTDIPPSSAAAASSSAASGAGQSGKFDRPQLDLVLYDDMADLHRLLAAGEQVAIWEPVIREMPQGRGRHLELKHDLSELQLVLVRDSGSGSSSSSSKDAGATDAAGGLAAGAAGAASAAGAAGAAGMDTEEQQQQQAQEEGAEPEPAAKRARTGSDDTPAAAPGPASLAQLVPGAADVVVVGSVHGLSSRRGSRAGSRLLRLQLRDGSAEVAVELLVGRSSRLQRQLHEGHVLLLAGEQAACSAGLEGLGCPLCCCAVPGSPPLVSACEIGICCRSES
jgi:hypothetical protein